MPKDTYASILSEIRNMVNRIFDLKKRVLTTRKKIVSASDEDKIGKLKKKLGI